MRHHLKRQNFLYPFIWVKYVIDNCYKIRKFKTNFFTFMKLFTIVNFEGTFRRFIWKEPCLKALLGPSCNSIKYGKVFINFS